MLLILLHIVLTLTLEIVNYHALEVTIHFDVMLNNLLALISFALHFFPAKV